MARWVKAPKLGGQRREARARTTSRLVTGATKYGNVKTRGYDSAKEAERARVLHLMEKAGKIRDLREQVKFELIPAQYDGRKCVERKVEYVADFVYVDCATEEEVVEDVKGVKTKEYIIKRKLLLWRHGIRIKEV